MSAVRIQTYSLKKDPRISAAAQKALDVAQGGSTTNFRSLYGNYFVAGITYRRRVRVRFTSQISKQVSEQSIRAAINASSACFSAHADMAKLETSLTAVGDTSVEIEIDGLNGAQVISIGAVGDLVALRDAVADLLSHFDDIPTGSGVEPVPGIPDQVKLRAYSTILPIQIDPFKTPNEGSVNVAFGDYIRLDRIRNRLSELSGRTYNLNLTSYLNRKSKEVETKRLTLVN
ncbi:MAG: hypothetical protein NT023_03730 [Armatimonadetes bacterium]|nr:hypothetical protein [Armatimonadota bacterium]